MKRYNNKLGKFRSQFNKIYKKNQQQTNIFRSQFHNINEKTTN